MPLPIDLITPVKAAESFNYGSAGPLAMADALLPVPGTTPNTNGPVFWPDITSANGADGYATITVTIRDIMKLAPGATGGPAAQTFDCWVELVKNTTANQFYFSNVGTGTLLDSTYADGRFISSGNPTSTGKTMPKIKARTSTGGVFTVRLNRATVTAAADAADTTTADATAGTVGVIVYGDWSFAPIHRFGAYITDFDA